MTLKKKLKICKECKKETYIFSKGRCKPCSQKSYATTSKKKKPKSRPLPTIPNLKKKARYIFQRYIRLRDIDTYCVYGCGAHLTDIRYYDAAHYLKFELYPEAGFDEHNVHGSCKGCNIRDPVLEYRKNLVLLQGEEYVSELEDRYKINRGTYKWDREYLNSIITKYSELCNQIEKKDEL